MNFIAGFSFFKTVFNSFSRKMVIGSKVLEKSFMEDLQVISMIVNFLGQMDVLTITKLIPMIHLQYLGKQ